MNIMDRRLKTYFDDDTKLVRRRKGFGYMWVCYKDKDGRRYGCCQHVKESDLKGRGYKLEGMGVSGGIPSILVTDTVYDTTIGRVKNQLRHW